MSMLSHGMCPVALALIALLAGSAAAQTADETRTPCTEDAMIVFDASGSMAGNTVQGLFSDRRGPQSPGGSVAGGHKVSQGRAHHLRPRALRAMQCRAKLPADPERGRGHH